MADAFDDVYFASCTPCGGIYRYRMYEDGSLCFADKISCDRPMYMTADGDVLHVLLRQPFTDIDESGLISYDIHSDGSLTERLPAVTTGGNVACHLCVFKKNIYAAHYVSGSIFSTGGRTVRLSGSSVHPERQNSPHPHMIIPSPDGKYLMCADLGADAILLYDENLNMIDKTRAPAGSGPRHICVLDVHHIACVDELSCTLSIYEYRDAHIRYLYSERLYEKPYAENFLGAAIRFNKNTVYVSTRGADIISVFRWDAGELKRIQVIPCGGKSPRDILPVNDKLLCMNEISSTVSVFMIHDDGLLKEKNKTDVSIAAVLCAVSRRKNNDRCIQCSTGF